ncbi:RagB/SusD family nutrient uptake outer membrane protein [Bacteroides sp. OttesenSCG-928-F21]|nr:RagB/SusD family nutrient uptake outer membrane protein [Bacteroides sp. OttesenSCG-928-F21]
MKLKNIFFGLTCIIAFASCGDKMDYREYTVYDKEYVLTNFTRTGALVTNVYSYLDSDLPGTNSLCSASDESEYAWSWATIHDYYNGAWSTINSKSMWSLYAGIRAANYFLEVYPEADFSEHALDKDYQSQMKRFNRYPYEVRLLRAYFYFRLVRAYGDVPFTEKVLTENEANIIERTSAAEVFNFIVSECDDVAGELPVRYTDLEDDAANGSNPDNGRVTRGMALALKARTLLYQASPLHNTTGDKEPYRKAAQANKAVIDFCKSNSFTLGKYTEIWGTDNWKASEMLYVRRIGDTNGPEVVNFPMGMEGGNSGNCPTQTLVDAYEIKATGKAWDEPESGYDPNKPYNNRDPRFAMTIAVNGEKWPSTNPNPLETYEGGRNGLPISGATPTGYYLKKYLDTSRVTASTNNNGGSRHSWVVFRLGEFYLNYAEALFNYLGTADATNAEFTMSAREAVNVVRKRSDVNMPEFPESMSASDFWTKYKRERMVELAFEQHRFWDVRRWKEGDLFKNITRMQIIKNSDDSFTYKRVTKSRVWDDKMYLFPIPQDERLKNPNLTQNPGWE